MLTGVLIIALSSALFIYWFRYSCILILRSRSESVAASAAVTDSRFGFAEVLEPSCLEPTSDALQASLDRDYRVLRYLIGHAAGLQLASLEDRLLMLDYRIMSGVYRLTRTAAPIQARKALSEMANVLSVLSHSIGQQAGVRNEA